MKITILTLFPEMFSGFLSNSIIKRAIAKNVVEIDIVNIRDYTKDRYGRVDSAPVGGGAGLIMKCQPIIDCLNSVKTKDSHVVMLSPRGQQYNQKKAHLLLNSTQNLILLCGHYEGIDERVNKYVDEQISIGDYILTGGEIGAMAIADSIIRLIPLRFETGIPCTSRMFFIIARSPNSRMQSSRSGSSSSRNPSRTASVKAASCRCV